MRGCCVKRFRKGREEVYEVRIFKGRKMLNFGIYKVFFFMGRFAIFGCKFFIFFIL